jgi:hypothetical protein
MRADSSRPTHWDRLEQDPSDETDDEDAGHGDTARLAPIGEAREEQHRDEGDGVGRDGEQLGLGVRVAETWASTSAGRMVSSFVGSPNTPGLRTHP